MELFVTLLDEIVFSTYPNKKCFCFNFLVFLQIKISPESWFYADSQSNGEAKRFNPLGASVR